MYGDSIRRIKYGVKYGYITAYSEYYEIHWSVVTPIEERDNIGHGRTLRMDIRALVMFLMVVVSLLMLFVAAALKLLQMFGQLKGRSLLWRGIRAGGAWRMAWRLRCMSCQIFD
jgi:hypothetical protein